MNRLSKIFGVRQAKDFARSTSGNVALMYGLTGALMVAAAGGAVDWTRAISAQSRLSAALDAAALAVGTANGLTDQQLQAKAQQYFDANYPADSSATPGPLQASSANQAISLSIEATLPTTLLKMAHIDTLHISAHNQVVRALTKLHVALALDNTGSMTQTDNTGTSKISALRTASLQLLDQLKADAINPGDVQVALVPFALDVNAGASNKSAGWIDWSNWDAAPPNSTPANTVGPGSNCPYTTGTNGFRCTGSPTNTSSCNVSGTSSCVSTIPSSGAYKGYICPSARSSSISNGGGGHYYNGCYDSVPTKTNTATTTATTPITTKQSCSQTGSGTITCNTNSGYPSSGTTTSSTANAVTNGYSGDSGPTTTTSTATNSTVDGTKSCTGSGANKKCNWTRTISQTKTDTTVTATGTSPYNHTWHANAHDTWTGCIMDRTQSYDTDNSAPVNTTTDFPAENNAFCPPASIMGLSYDWTALQSAVNAMTANGSTNQTIGLAWAWQALTGGAPMNAPPADNLTSEVIILLSDGLNTQNRWHGDGSTTDTTVDAREALACTNAKSHGIVIYTLFVDLGGTSGNSVPLRNCASDAGKYFDLTTSGQIVSAFHQIGTELANLHLSQ